MKTTLAKLWVVPVLVSVLVAGALVIAPAAPAAAAGQVKYYKVRSSYKGQQEFLCEIAERFLADCHRYREIFQLNKGRKQPDGRRLVKETEIEAGWYLILPGDARGSGVVFGVLPCCEPKAPAAPPRKQPPPKRPPAKQQPPAKQRPADPPAERQQPPQQRPVQQAPQAPPRQPERCATPSSELVKEVPWAQKRLAPDRAWSLTKGRGVTVGVVDSGVDASVPQLAGKVLPGVDVTGAQPTGRGDTDCLGHGTFVAGIIAAGPRQGTALTGIAPDVRILPVRQAKGSNDGTASSLARGIRSAVDRGARVVNVSTSSFLPSDELRNAVEYAASKDVLIVAAASNEAEEGNPAAYPAAYKQVLAVGAIGPDGKRGDFSETGYYLDLVAPGVDVASLSRGGPGHVVDKGTSYAAPFVAGVAALVRAYHPNLTAEQVKRRLETTADHPGQSVPNAEVGYGVVNPTAALTTAIPGERKQGANAAPGGGTASGSSAGSTGASTGIAENEADPVVDAAPRTTALAFTALLVGIGILLAFLAVVIPRGQRRRWRSHASGASASKETAA